MPRSPWHRRWPPPRAEVLPFRGWSTRRTLFFLLAGTIAVVLPLFVSYRIQHAADLAGSVNLAGLWRHRGDRRRHGPVRRAHHRLIGFDTPETGMHARCERERALGTQATRSLRELLGGRHALTRVRCACPSGTEGTSARNYGRLCARLRVQGRDVGSILIGEGLARPFICGSTSCPPRARWC
jgi:endonuclease YncB( thermonuclease family)